MLDRMNTPEPNPALRKYVSGARIPTAPSHQLAITPRAPRLLAWLPTPMA